MDKSVIFGAGGIGKEALELIGKDKIEFFLDNDINKNNTFIEGVPVYNLKGKIDNNIIIAVSNKHQNEIIEQIKNLGITNYRLFSELKEEIAKKRFESASNNIDIYNRAINWIKLNSIDGEGIICNSSKKMSYPEVTGYYIPTLIRWGYRDFATSYAKWLVSIQKEDGSWYDTDNKAPYIFDTAQILKGLLAVRSIYPFVDDSIKRGCDYLVSSVNEEGRLITPSKDCWGEEKTCSELIHLYCLTPLIDASKVFNNNKYKEIAYKVLNYYKNNYYEDIVNFGLLSHFYAYVMEGLIDLGEREIVSIAMNKLKRVLDEKGYVPAYNDVNWVCSTGLFQLALVWYKLGDLISGDKAFEYACRLQNDTGGWYGSYLVGETHGEDNTYFPVSEISWANKYFLDALYYKNLSHFDDISSHFLSDIPEYDERYKTLERLLNTKIETSNSKLRILDLGCGKGRYTKRLKDKFPNNEFYAADISEKVLGFIEDDNIIKSVGTLTNTSFDNGYFDFVFTSEAVEHAVDIYTSIKEIRRILKVGGQVVIIDKNKKSSKNIVIDSWEQWLDENETTRILNEFFSKVTTYKDLMYEGKIKDDLFIIFSGIAK